MNESSSQDARGSLVHAPEEITMASLNGTFALDVIKTNYDVTYNVIASVLLIFSSLGTAGNLLLLFVLMSQLLRKNSYATYMAAVCVADISLLVISMAESGVMLTEGKLTTGRSMPCAMTALKHYSRCMSVWCVQLLTIDRLVAIFQPTRRNVICTWRKAVAACCMASLLLLLFYLVPCVTYLSMSYSEPDHDLHILGSFMHACGRYGDWYSGASIVDFVITYAIPMCVIFPSWIVIFKRIAIRSKKAQVIGVTEKWTAERIRRLNKTTLGIGTMVNVSALATIPYGVNMLVVHYRELSTTNDNMYTLFGMELLDMIGRGSHVYLLSCVSGQFRRSVYAMLCPDRVALDADLMASSARRSALVDRLAPVAKTASRDKRVVGLNLKNRGRRATPHPMKHGTWVPPHLNEKTEVPIRSLKDLSPSFDNAPSISGNAKNVSIETMVPSDVTSVQFDVVTYI